MVIFSVVGFSELNLVILAGNIASFLAIPLFAQEVKKVMKNKNSKELLSHESPIDWVKDCIKFVAFSLLSSLVYGVVSVQNLIPNQPQNLDFLFYFGIVFFLLELLYLVRVVWFIVDPSSTANIFAGKLL
jgi:hypothetical protein